jgi:hypothetical protein
MMRKRTFIAVVIAGLASSGAAWASPAHETGGAGDAAIARALDGLDVAFARHTREHRMWEIQRNLEWQNRGRGYGYGRGYNRDYGYGRGRGYGPPPGYGYRRGYGYGGRGYVGGGSPYSGSRY